MFCTTTLKSFVLPRSSGTSRFSINLLVTESPRAGAEFLGQLRHVGVYNNHIMFYTSPIFLRQQANSRSPQWMTASFEPILPLNKMMFSCWVGFCVTLLINQRHCSAIFQIFWPSNETSSILNSTLLPSSCWFVALFQSSPINRISRGIHLMAMKHFFLTLGCFFPSLCFAWCVEARQKVLYFARAPLPRERKRCATFSNHLQIPTNHITW